MENILQANNDIQGVFAQNDEMALGAAEAMGNREGVVIVGFDGTEDGLKAIEEGRMTATIAQNQKKWAALHCRQRLTISRKNSR